MLSPPSIFYPLMNWQSTHLEHSDNDNYDNCDNLKELDDHGDYDDHVDHVDYVDHASYEDESESKQDSYEYESKDTDVMPVLINKLINPEHKANKLPIDSPAITLDPLPIPSVIPSVGPEVVSNRILQHIPISKSFNLESFYPSTILPVKSPNKIYGKIKNKIHKLEHKPNPEIKTSDQLAQDLINELLTPIEVLKVGFSFPSKITTFICPYCLTSNSIFTSKTYENFIKCTNKSCPLVYIPRNLRLYNKLKLIVKSRWINRYTWIGFYARCEIENQVGNEAFDTDQVPFIKSDLGDFRDFSKPIDEDISNDYVECIGCSRNYIRYTVLHNDKFSVCPDCLFFNPHILTKEMKEIDDPCVDTTFRKCLKCKMDYDIDGYYPPETTSIFGEVIYKNICATCALDDPTMSKLIIQDYKDAGNSFVRKYPSIDTYLSVDFDSEHLFSWTFSYLPQIPII